MALKTFFGVLRVILTKVLPALLGLAVLVLIIAALSGLFGEKIEPGHHASTPQQHADQPTDLVHRITQEHYEEAVGTLKAAARTVISSRVLASIDEMTVTAGDQVEEDQLLVSLSSAELEARLRQAEQALVAATASREESERELERANGLRQRSPGAITAAEYDQINSRAQIARADEIRQRQAVEEARVLLSYTQIRAPVAGRVVDRLAEPGDTVTPGQPLLVLYDATSLRMEAPVVERLAVVLRSGDELKVHIDSLDRDLIGRVDVIVPQSEARSRSLLVKVSLPSEDDLIEGMSGRVIIPAGRREHLCLAASAVRRVGQLEMVDVVLRDGSLQRRLIKTGRLGIPGRLEVLSGLNPGEEVVLYEGTPPPLPEDSAMPEDAAPPGDAAAPPDAGATGP